MSDITKRVLNVFTALRQSGRVKNQSDFSKKLNYNRSYVSELLSGKNTITDNFIGALATVFNVRPEYITGQRGEMFLDSPELQKPGIITIANDILATGENIAYVVETGQFIQGGFEVSPDAIKYLLTSGTIKHTGLSTHNGRPSISYDIVNLHNT